MLISTSERTIENTALKLNKNKSKTTQYCFPSSSPTALYQSINYTLAVSSLTLRRATRSIDRIDRLVETGQDYANTEVVWGWLIDHSLFIWDLIWGYIGPLITMIYWLLIRLVLVLVFNYVFFYLVYKVAVKVFV